MDAHEPRKEFKFRLEASTFEAVRAELATRLLAPEASPDLYEIESIYFDSEDHESYWQKKFSFPNRRRVRTRLYRDIQAGRPPAAFLEVKHKLCELTVKRRLTIEASELDETRFQGLPAVAPPAPPVKEEIDELMAQPGTRPVVRIRYQRTAFDQGPGAPIRVTFDSRIRFTFWDDGHWQEERALIPTTEAVMELKIPHVVPYWFRDLVGRHRLIPHSFSKFAQALDHRLCPITRQKHAIS